MKNKNTVIALLATLIMLGGIFLSFNGQASAQQVPGLEVEESFHLGELTLVDIQTTMEPSNGYTDLLAGWAEGADFLTGERQLYAVEYTNGIPQWFRSVLIINPVNYTSTMFSGVDNYVFVGSANSTKKTSSLVMKLEPSNGFMQSYLILDPGDEYGSKLLSIARSNRTGGYVAVGALNNIDWTVPDMDRDNRGMILLLNQAGTNTSAPIIALKIASGLNDVAVFNDPTSPMYGYIVVAGYTVSPTQAPQPLVVVLDNTMSIVASIKVNTSAASWINTVAIINDQILVGGEVKTGQKGLDGFIALLQLSQTPTIQWIQYLSSYGHDSIHDLEVSGDHIAFTGTYSKTGNTSALVLGELAANGTIERAYMYTGKNTAGLGVSHGPRERLHAVGTTSGLFPSTLTLLPQQAFQQGQPIGLAPVEASLSSFNPVFYHEQFNDYARYPIIDSPTGALMGLYLVTGEFFARPTNQTTGIPTNNSNTTLNFTNIGGPGPAYTEACIDISTGTTPQGTPDVLGAVENPITDYPDWGVVSPQQLQAITSSFQSWSIPAQSNSRWITAYAYTNGSPMVTSVNNPFPDTVYSITFSIQTPSFLKMNWTADNGGYLYIDGVLVQSAILGTLSNYTTLLQPGTHTLSVKVRDSGVVTGLFVDGTVCPPEPINHTGHPYNQTPTNGEPIGNSTGTDEPCGCQGTIALAVGAMAGISALSVGVTYILSRRTG